MDGVKRALADLEAGDVVTLANGVKVTSSKQACQLIGCTYRQAYYWAANGTLHLERKPDGSGDRAGWSADNIAKARLVAVLMPYFAHNASTITAGGVADALLLGASVQLNDYVSLTLEGDPYRGLEFLR